MNGKNLTPEQLAKWRLIRTSGIGPVAYRRLLNMCETAENALAELPNLAAQNKRKSPKVPSLSDVTQEAETLYKAGGQAIFIDETNYPSLLSHIPDPPPMLQVLGNIEVITPNAIGIVGSRNASVTGRKFTHDLAKELAEQGFLIVSGLARGIDKAAHVGALNAKKPTVAVVAGGVDHIYPPQNKDLREKIIATGCIISENPFGMMPTARHFPRRNRIISGLTKAVLVTEASRHSGSLITAKYAGEQGRDVFAVPGSPADPKAAGGNHLLKQGAQMLENIDDILNSLNMNFTSSAPVSYTREAETSNLFEEEIIPEGEPELEELNTLPKTDVEIIENLLSSAPAPLDIIIRQAKLSEPETLIALTELELSGRIVRHPNGDISLG